MPPPHDGQADEQHRILEAVPHQGADQADAQQRQRHASQDHRQVAHGSVFQQGAAHAEHGAGHQAGDEEVQKASLLHEAGDHLTRFGRQDSVLEQGGAAEDGEYGATPQIFPDGGDALAQLAQQGAEHEHQRQGADHAKRQGAVPAGVEDAGGEPEENHHGHASDLLVAPGALHLYFRGREVFHCYAPACGVAPLYVSPPLLSVSRPAKPYKNIETLSTIQPLSAPLPRRKLNVTCITLFT